MIHGELQLLEEPSPAFAGPNEGEVDGPIEIESESGKVLLEVRELRQETRGVVLQRELAFLDEHHRGERIFHNLCFCSLEFDGNRTRGRAGLDGMFRPIGSDS